MHGFTCIRLIVLVIFYSTINHEVRSVHSSDVRAEDGGGGKTRTARSVNWDEDDPFYAPFDEEEEEGEGGEEGEEGEENSYDDENEARSAQKVLIYNNRQLGQVGPDEPLMHVGLLPLADFAIGTNFTVNRARKMYLTSEKTVLKLFERTILFDNIKHSLLFMFRCEVLTVTIHGYSSSPSVLLNNALHEYQATNYEKPCNLIVDWSEGAKNRGGIYKQPGEARES